MNMSKVGLRLDDAGAHRVEGQLRRIVGAAEVREPEPAHPVTAPGAQHCLGSLRIRKMPRRAQDTLFEVIGIGTAQQALAVMIYFSTSRSAWLIASSMVCVTSPLSTATQTRQPPALRR